VVHGLKTLIAALLAWGVVAPWASDGRSYLAVATALLMVNASTVYQSVTRAVQSVVARVGGLILALATARLLGATAAAVAVIVVIAVLAGPRRTSDDRLQIASTAVIALAATAADPVGSLLSPTFQTLAGAAVGLAVNALVLPPLYLDESDSAVRDLAHAMGTLLHDMGTGLARRQLTTKAHTWLHPGAQPGQAPQPRGGAGAAGRREPALEHALCRPVPAPGCDPQRGLQRLARSVAPGGSGAATSKSMAGQAAPTPARLE
jgi:uncharacterized membrane protein YgaE (UPF0421/DUF939 family)